MAIVDWNDKTFPQQTFCFVCGELLLKTYIFWQGGDGTAIGLHIDCANSIGRGLLKEVVKAKLEIPNE